MRAPPVAWSSPPRTCGSSGRATTSRSRRKSTAPRSCSSTATCGSGAGARWRSHGCATRSSRRSATSSTSGTSPSWIRRSSAGRSASTPGRCSTEYFDLGKAYLAQTGQLYVEAAAAALGKVYCFGPTFRAEKSKTRRHLTEFLMVEPEVAWNDSDANMRLQEEFVSHIVTRALERRNSELAELERDVKQIEAVRPPFPRISYSDAVAKLKALGSDIEWGQDLGGEAETLLAKQYDRPVMVFNYPRAVKAFYMKENPADPRTVLNNDMLAPEGYGEIIGGSQREDDYDKLLARIRAEQLPEE